jgi:hypothetical protein
MKKAQLAGQAGMQVAFAAMAVKQIREARQTGDMLEVLDAVASAAVVVTGLALIVRRLRRGGVQ